MASISLILQTVFAVLFETKTENNTHPKEDHFFFYFKRTRFVPFKFKELHDLYTWVLMLKLCPRYSARIALIINYNYFGCFEQALSESVTSVCGGCVSSASYDEIVAATYAGWVVGLNSEPQQKEAGPSVGAQEPISEEVQAKMDNLRCDIHWLITI